MTIATILPEPRTIFLDVNNNPLSGGSVYTYVPNTTTPKTTWQDAAGSTSNSNPIVLDGQGSCLLYGSGQYTLSVYDNAGNLIYTGLTQDLYSFIVNGNNTWTGTNTFSGVISFSGLTLSGTSTFSGSIISTGNNTWSGTNTFSGSIISTGNNTWSGTNTFSGSTTAVTQSTSDTSTFVATDAFVHNVVNGISSSPNYYNGPQTSPLGTTSTSGKMMGFAGSITPTNSGVIFATISGYADNGSAGDGYSVGLYYGTGTAPTNGASPAGTQIGSNAAAPGLSQGFPFTCSGYFTATLNTAYWLDAKLAAVTAGTATIVVANISANEVK